MKKIPFRAVLGSGFQGWVLGFSKFYGVRRTDLSAQGFKGLRAWRRVGTPSQQTLKNLHLYSIKGLGFRAPKP